MPPLVSVLFPVYNGAPYLAGAISSVLSQANCEFEMVVVNDGSVDASADIIRQFRDPRIHYFEQDNKGLAATLNRAIRLAQGTYLARQDQDDFSFPERFRKQVAFLDAHPEVGMVGSCAQIWVENENTGRLLAHPADDASLQFHLLFDNPFVHSSVMIRRSALDELGGYAEDSSRQPPEDYELWSRMARKFKVANLPEVLLAYREVGGSMSRSGDRPFLRNLMSISAENIAWASGREAAAPEVVALSRLTHGIYDHIPQGVRFGEMKGVLQEAARRIARKSVVPLANLEGLLQKRLARLRYHCLAHRTGGLSVKLLGGTWGRYFRNVASRMGSVWRP